MDPAILVFSEGDITPLDVIKNILEANGSVKADIKAIENENENSMDTPAFQLNLKTKYYENSLNLIPMENKLNAVPNNIRELTEAIVIYFNANNKSFLNDLPEICNWLTERNIELGILITDSLNDKDSGISKADIHKVCSESKFIFDVIELADAHEDEDEEAERKHDYHEVLTSLKSNIWSNIDCKKPKAMNVSANVANANDNEHMEDQLEAFSNLMSSIQTFQRISGSLSRDQVYDQAEKLAELLCSTIMDGDDMDDYSDDNDDSQNDDTSVEK